MKLSARRTAAMIPLGGLVAASGFLLLPLMRPPRHEPLGGIAAITFGVLLMGFLISRAGDKRLQRGIIREQWSQTEMDALRGLVISPRFAAVQCVLVLAFAISILTTARSRPYGWAIFMLIQSLNYLRIQLQTTSPAMPYQTTWSGLQPLHSQHWGQR